MSNLLHSVCQFLGPSMLLPIALLLFFFFFYGWITYCIFFTHCSVGKHLGCFHALTIVNGTAMNIGVHLSFWIMVCSGYVPRSGIQLCFITFISQFNSKEQHLFIRVIYFHCKEKSKTAGSNRWDHLMASTSNSYNVTSANILLAKISHVIKPRISG